MMLFAAAACGPAGAPRRPRGTGVVSPSAMREFPEPSTSTVAGGRDGASAAGVDARYAHVWTISAGAGVRVDAYYDPEEARATLEP